MDSLYGKDCPHGFFEGSGPQGCPQGCGVTAVKSVIDADGDLVLPFEVFNALHVQAYQRGLDDATSAIEKLRK